MITKSYEISKIFKNNITVPSPGENGKCNIILNNANYSYINGLIHVDYLEQTGVVFISENYDEFYLKDDVCNILNLLDCKYTFYSKNIKIINLKELVSKLIDSNFSNLNYSVRNRIGIQYNNSSISMIYKIKNHLPINIITKINNINLTDLKRNIYNSINQFLIDISTFLDNHLDDVLYEHFSSVTRFANTYINFETNNINFLNYVCHNTKIVSDASNNLEVFEKLMTLANTSIREVSKNNLTLKKTDNFQLLFKYEDSCYSDLIIKFKGLTIPFLDSYYKDIKIFTIAYLIYLNEYDKLVTFLKSELFKTM
jgi:hypothetical protein